MHRYFQSDLSDCHHLFTFHTSSNRCEATELQFKLSLTFTQSIQKSESSLGFCVLNTIFLSCDCDIASVHTKVHRTWKICCFVSVMFQGTLHTDYIANDYLPFSLNTRVSRIQPKFLTQLCYRFSEGYMFNE